MLQEAPAEAHDVVRQAHSAIVTNDGAKLSSLFAAEVTIAKNKLTRADAAAQVTAAGAQAFTKFVPNVFEDAGGKHCEWSNLATAKVPKKSDTFEMYMGSGYGETPTVWFGVVDGAWRIIAIDVVDNGAP